MEMHSEAFLFNGNATLKHFYFLLEINGNATLKAKLSEYTTAATQTSFGLQHFTYNNPYFLQLMFNNLHNLEFLGIVVSM